MSFLIKQKHYSAREEPLAEKKIELKFIRQLNLFFYFCNKGRDQRNKKKKKKRLFVSLMVVCFSV